MSDMPQPGRLGNHHRDTLARIFRHPISNNIDWQAVLSLLNAVGSVTESHEGTYAVTLGSETESFDRPASKDIDAQQVVDLRRMLRNAGYAPDVESARG